MLYTPYNNKRINLMRLRLEFKQGEKIMEWKYAELRNRYADIRTGSEAFKIMRGLLSPSDKHDSGVQSDAKIQPGINSVKVIVSNAQELEEAIKTHIQNTPPLTNISSSTNRISAVNTSLSTNTISSTNTSTSTKVYDVVKASLTTSMLALGVTAQDVIDNLLDKEDEKNIEQGEILSRHLTNAIISWIDDGKPKLSGK